VETAEMSRVITPALAVFAQHLGVRHSPLCRQLSQDYNGKQYVSWLRRYQCNCGLAERLQDALHDQIRRDIKNGIKRNLEEEG
jgi:hypothetical protein